MNPPTGIDLAPELVKKIEDLFSGKYKATDPKEEAQLRELAFWRWVAYEGYAGKSPIDFIDHQRVFMTNCYAKTGWPINKYLDKSIFELGCGPLGMIEFIPGHKRHAFDPLNTYYSQLFQNFRSSNINYIDQEAQIEEIEAADLGISFNVLDHTEDADYWFNLFFSKIKFGGHFIFQVNTVKDGFDRTEEHKKMHPSPQTYEQIIKKIKKVSSQFSEDYRTTPSADNEFFFMAWGVRRKPNLWERIRNKKYFV